MNRLQLAFLLSSSLGIAAVACGGISDPTKGNGEARVATVSGALTGVAVPANARVALVYRKVTTTSAGSHGSVEVGSDVPVVGGKFTMNLGVPAADYFASVDGSALDSVSAPPSSRELPAPAPATNDAPPSAGTGGGSTSGGGGAFGAGRLAPRDLVGGSITEPLTAALAGFVVYADTNGNGKLDLEGDYASSPDQILGGNKELILVYLKGGGSLDYEKMRDKSGILPATGFNLAWTEGRWLPLNEVELKLASNAQLPSPVCDTYVASGSGSSGSADVPVTDPSPPTSGGGSGGSAGTSGGSSSGSSSGGTFGPYPSAGDPNLHCAPDGRSFTYTPSGTGGCAPSPPPPTGLCAGDVYGTTTDCAGPAGYGTSLAADQPVPAGWPCPVAVDAGVPDAAVDAGSADGG